MEGGGGEGGGLKYEFYKVPVQVAIEESCKYIVLDIDIVNINQQFCPLNFIKGYFLNTI